MAEKNTDSNEPSSEGLDLSALSGLDFGPNWADEKKTNSSRRERPAGRERPRGERQRGDRRPNRSGSGADSRDRRAGGRPERRGRSDSNHGQESERRPRRGRGGPRDNERRAPQFEPTVKIDLYPQDDAFDALVKRLRASARTYELFDIAKLLLEKPERYMVVVSPKENAAAKAEEKKPLFYSVPGHLPFETEAEAVNFVLNNHLDIFFDIEECEVEPPSGNFQMVHKCGVTGELLGPPNYHRYQQFVQKHFDSKISNMSFEKFQSKVVSVKEQEDIDAWLESMKKSQRYTLKTSGEGDPQAFETFESARQYLLMNRKSDLVGSNESIRFAGRDIERMAPGGIRRSVEAYIEQQQTFPLDTANNIRGRLRRHKFAVYKKGSKGVSYVCAVKRQFRDSKTSFTDSIRGLIEFIERNPETLASKLPKLYIGIDTEKQHPEVLKMSEAENDTAQAAPEKPADSGAEQPSPETADTASEKMATTTDAQPKAELTAEEQAALRQLMLDLRWLITEGYVTEYGDGRLFAPPPMPESTKKPTSDEPKPSASDSIENATPETSTETPSPDSP